jgi:hypothetical protein
VRTLAVLLLLSSCGSAEARRAEVLARAEAARAAGDLDLAEKILVEARKRGPEDPVIALRLAEFLEKRARHESAFAIVRSLPESNAQLGASGRLAAKLRYGEWAIEAIAKLYRRGRGGSPEARSIIRYLGMNGGRLSSLEQLAQELRLEGDHALLRSWIAELPADHPSRPHLDPSSAQTIKPPEELR